MALTKTLLGSGGGSGITELTGDVTAGPGSGSEVATIANGAVDIAHLSATGTPSATTYLRGDNTWNTPAGGTPAEVLISEQTPSGTGTVTFSSIAATYRDLRIVVRGRGSVVATATNVRLRFNSDSGANYDWEIGEHNGTSTAVAQNFAQTSLHIGYLAGSTATANAADVCEARIYDYRGTTFQKAIISNAAAKTTTASGGLFRTNFSGFWRSTSAITDVEVTLASGNFSAGSVVSLYGIL
jgi:hypothetical protein